MKIRRISAAAAFVAVGAVVLAACSNAPGNSTPTSTGSVAAPTSAAPATGGTLTVAETNAFSSFNYNSANGNSDINAKIVSYPTRSWFNYVDGNSFAAGGVKLIKDESFGKYEVLSKDPLTVKYTVNEGVVWSDGVPVDASDLLLSWAIDSGHYNSPGADGKSGTKDDVSYFDYAGDTGTLSLTAFPTLGDDGRSLTLTYSKPAADWEIAFAADAPAHVVATKAGLADSKALIDLLTSLKDTAPKATAADPKLKAVSDFWNTGFDTTVLPADKSLYLSDGPYIVSDIVENQSVTLVPNTKYVGNLKPKLDSIVAKTIPDATAAVQALQNGDVDVISPQASADTLAALKAVSGATLLQGDQLAYDHLDLTFNNGGPFDPKTYGGDAAKALKVRQAFLKTVPRQAILDAIVTPLKPTAKVLDSQIFVPAQANYADTITKNGSSAYPPEPDIAGAKALLAEAGVTNPTVRVMYNIKNPNRVNSFQLLQKQATDAGFTIVNDGQEKWSAILGDGSYDATIFGWVNPGIGVSGTPQLFRSDGGGNYSGYANATVDSLSDQLVVELDPTKQADIQEKIDAQLFPDAFGLPLFQSVGVDAVNARVGGITAYNPSQSGVWWNTWDWTVSK